jgi:hypothetical protein
MLDEAAKHLREGIALGRTDIIKTLLEEVKSTLEGDTTGYWTFSKRRLIQTIDPSCSYKRVLQGFSIAGVWTVGDLLARCCSGEFHMLQVRVL